MTPMVSWNPSRLSTGSGMILSQWDTWSPYWGSGERVSLLLTVLAWGKKKALVFGSPLCPSERVRKRRQKTEEELGSGNSLHEPVHIDSTFRKRASSKAQKRKDEDLSLPEAWTGLLTTMRMEFMELGYGQQSRLPTHNMVKCRQLLSYLKNIPFYGQEERL